MGIKGNSNIKVHRLVFELHNNVDATGLIVRHRCDNPKCINPEHLLIGTVADNVLDMDLRGRRGSAKLTHKDVYAIRDLLATCRYSAKDIAKMFNVSDRTITAIKRGDTWKYI